MQESDSSHCACHQSLVVGLKACWTVTLGGGAESSAWNLVWCGERKVLCAFCVVFALGASCKPFEELPSFSLQFLNGTCHQTVE